VDIPEFEFANEIEVREAEEHCVKQLYLPEARFDLVDNEVVYMGHDGC
jgi:hypothetical protein